MTGNPPGRTSTDIMCPHCYTHMDVRFHYPFGDKERLEAMRAAMDEHRRVCVAAPPEAQRVYRLTYPRDD